MTEVTVEKKAYDLKLLVEKLKEGGIELLEEEAKVLIKATFAWLTESAVISKTPYDNMAAIVYPQVEGLILDQAEKINPED